MFNKKGIRTLILGFTIFSFAITSFSGSFASTVYASEIQQEDSEQISSDKSKGVVGGLLALGLFAILTNHGSNKGSSSDLDKKASDSDYIPSAPASNPPPTTSTKPSGSQGLTADEQKAINLLNADRAKAGLPALRVNMDLVRLAEKYSQDMINRNFFSHYNPEGQSPFDRMRAEGISYVYAGENIAINRSVEGAEVAFMNSPGHRANILNPNFTEVGIGVRYSSNGSVYVSQEFIGR